MSGLSWKQYFMYQTDYQHWATQVLFECLDRLDPKALMEPQGLYFDSIHHTVDHILVVAELWRMRLQGEHPITDMMQLHHPDWRELKKALQIETRELQHWLERQPDSYFDSEASYRSTDGKERCNWVRDILTHMMTHMAHHRGQVSGAATRLGAPAAEMDYIYYKRSVDSALEQTRKA